MRKQKWLMEDKTKQRNNIWFFGDSFCAQYENWVKYISDNYNVKHLGTGGTGIQHTIMDYTLYKDNIKPNDKVVVCYNSMPSRILIRFHNTDVHHSFIHDSQLSHKLTWVVNEPNKQFNKIPNEWEEWKRQYTDEEIQSFYELYHDNYTEEVKNIYLINSLHHLLHQEHNDVLEFFSFIPNHYKYKPEKGKIFNKDKLLSNTELTHDIMKWYDFNKLPSLMDFTSSFYNDHEVWQKENGNSPNHFQDFMVNKFKETYEV